MNKSRTFDAFPINSSNLTSPAAIFFASKQAAAQIDAWIPFVLASGAFGTLANVIVLLALAVHTPLRKSDSAALITHGVAIDLYICAVGIPGFTLLQFHLDARRQFPPDTCRIQRLIYIALPAEMYAACVLAVYRFIAAIFPHYFSLLKQVSQTVDGDLLRPLRPLRLQWFL